MKIIIKIPTSTVELHSKEIDDILNDCNESLGELDSRVTMTNIE